MFFSSSLIYRQRETALHPCFRFRRHAGWQKMISRAKSRACYLGYLLGHVEREKQRLLFPADPIRDALRPVALGMRLVRA